MISTPEVVIRLAAAAALGALIGLERERVEPAAGLRTHAVVALGAALFMLVSMFGFGNAISPPSVILDPSRVAAQIVSGIGFLGAGVIIFRKEIIRGLTTAASVWLVAAIGMAIGGGLYVPAVCGTALALAFLAGMKPLERKLGERRRPRLLTLVVDRRHLSLQALQETLVRSGATVEEINAKYEDDPGKSRLDVVLRDTPAERVLQLLEVLADEPGVREVRSSVLLHVSGVEQEEQLSLMRRDGDAVESLELGDEAELTPKATRRRRADSGRISKQPKKVTPLRRV